MEIRSICCTAYSHGAAFARNPCLSSEIVQYLLYAFWRHARRQDYRLAERGFHSSSGSRLCPLCTSVLFDSPTKRGAPEHNKCAMEQFKAGIIEVNLDDIVKSRCATSANIPYECPEFQGPGIFNNHCASRQWRLPEFSISRSFLSCASLFVMEPLRVGAARRPYSAARREAKSNLFNLHTDVASAHAPVCSSIRSQMEQLGMISKGAWQFDP